MATSKMLQQVAEVAAEAKFERMYAGGKITDDVEALKAFLVKLWVGLIIIKSTPLWSL